MDSPTSMPTPHRPVDSRTADADVEWRRLRRWCIVAPVAFIVALQVLRPVVFDRLWPAAGDLVVSTLTALAAIGFGVLVWRLIERRIDRDRVHTTLGERERIARELHDSLAQVLGATNLRLRLLAAGPELADRPQARAELTEVADTCRDAYTDVREAILGLKSASGDDVTLVDGLRSYATSFARQSGIDTRVVVDGPADPGLTPAGEIHAIRIVQEALTNARKHSGARAAVVRIVAEPASVVVTVEDDGCGFDPDRRRPAGGEGFGMTSMRERAHLVHGSLHVASAPGTGTRVVATLPRVARPARPIVRTIP